VKWVCDVYGPLLSSFLALKLARNKGRDAQHFHLGSNSNQLLFWVLLIRSNHLSDINMAQETNSSLKKGGDVLRELANHQGAAYRRYGEALQKFGAGETSASDLFKVAGDLYFQEAGRISAGLFAASSEVFTWALGRAGIDVTTDGAAAKKPKVKQ